MFKKAMTCAGSAILAGALIFGPVSANAAPAASPAATVSVGVAEKKAVKAGVSIQTIGKKTVTEKTVKVKPSYKKVGKPKIVSATLTVKQGSKTVAKNKASVNLKPGTYKVTQTVKYKLASGKKWGSTKTATKTQTLKVTKAVKAGVSIQTIDEKTVTENTVKVKPSYKKVGKPKIVSATLTVKQGSKTVAMNKASVNLKPGTYKVTQTVKYKRASGKEWGKTKTATKTQTLKVGVVAWESYFRGYQAGEVKTINEYRKSKGLKALTFDKALSEKALELGVTPDWEALNKYPASMSWSGPAIEGYEVKNDDWYAAGHTFGYWKVSGNESLEGRYADFLKKGLTKVGVGIFITWDNDKTKRPELYDSWMIAR